jgi:tRNA-binding EMAP/Myf-like protein
MRDDVSRWAAGSRRHFAPVMRAAAALASRASRFARSNARAPGARARGRARSTVARETRANGKADALAPLEQRVDLRVGRVLSAKRHEDAEKLVRGVDRGARAGADAEAGMGGRRD